MRTRLAAATTALVAAAVLLTVSGTRRSDVTAAASAPTSTAPAASRPAPTRPTAPTSTTAPRDPLLGSGRPVTIAFAGDTNFSREGQMAARLAADPATAVGPFSTVLAAADLAFGNLETAIGTSGTPEAKQYAYEAPPTALDAMRAAGFDAVSLANNHGRDYGAEGLTDSLAARAAQPGGFVIGIGGDDADALRPFRAVVNGQRIAVIAATQVIDAELVAAWSAAPGHPGVASAKQVDRLVRAVQEARADSDTVVVFLHWGVEHVSCPSADQRSLAATLADAGADIVIGGHSHVLGGAGFLGRAFVGYGLGNFDFYASDAEAAKTGIVRVTVTGRRVDAYDFVPGHVDGALAKPLQGPAADDAIAAWQALRDCTGLAATAG